MSEMAVQRKKAQHYILDAFARTTERPIGLFHNGGETLDTIFSDESMARFEPHCRYLWSLPGGRERCELDHCGRAYQTLHSGQPCLAPCHAGLYNQAVPVLVRGETRAVLMYGQMRIAGCEYEGVSQQRHQALLQTLPLTAEQAVVLDQLFETARTYTLDELDELKQTWPELENFVYFLFDEEDRLKQSVERVKHEIQTRLQAVIANAENLKLESGELNEIELRTLTDEVLASAEALDTVVQTLGDYLEEYRFSRRSIAQLLRDARRVYRAEAKRRGVRIRIRFIGPPASLELSHHHMQLALNNLLHNAVKYSFRGSLDRERTVWVVGRADTDYYRLTIENYGVGILQDEKDAIFGDGYQGRLTRGEYRTGSGKGLYFVKNVIDQHQGRIEVESVLQADEETLEGKPHLNRFVVYLPYHHHS